MAITEKDRTYIAWQNRAFWFYLAARTCWAKGFDAPAAFLSQQCIEQLVKATLLRREPSFDPKNDGGHDLRGMSQRIQKKVDGQACFSIPDYLCDGKYQSRSRYPDGQGFGVPGSLISDLDKLFADLIEMVRFQFNSQLYCTLLYPKTSPTKKARYKNCYEELERGNTQMGRLHNHVVGQGSSP